jgi:hypothetical protein
VPVVAPDLPLALIGLALVLGLTAFRLWSGGSRLEAGRRPGLWLCAGGALVALVGLVVLLARGGRAWVYAASELIVLVPLLLVWFSLARIWRQRTEPGSTHAKALAPQPLVLFTLYGAIAVLHLYPAADPAHVIMSMPAMLPLLAPCLATLAQSDPAGAPRVGARWVALGLVGLLALPPVYVLATTRATKAVRRLEIPRATGIEVMGRLYRDGARLVEYLDRPEHLGRRLLVVSGKPMVYFLSGRPSLLDRFEFEFYLTGLGVLEEREARQRVDQQAILRVLRQSRPLIVSDDFDPAAARFARAYPLVWSYIQSRTSRVQRIGGFQLLDWLPDHAGPARQEGGRPGS